MPFQDITESFPAAFAGAGSEALSFFNVSSDSFDVSIGELPFLLYITEEHPYERVSAQWRKDQFDNLPNVGEQSLVGWWLRSQIAFNGGSGIEYFEPLQARDILIDRRFQDSHGVDVLRPDGSVRLLPDVTQLFAVAGSVTSMVASSTRLLLVDGSTPKVWDGSTLNTVTMPGASPATKVAYTGSSFLIGHSTGIATLDPDTGTTATALWTNAADDVDPYWAKERIFATVGTQVFELTLAGGDISTETPIFTHPNTNWQWVSVTETGGAVWLAGFAGEHSAVHVLSVAADGSLPALTASTVAIQFPDGEIANEIRGYLDFLLVATGDGFRVAFTQGDVANLGPLVFEDTPVHSLVARGDFVWAGMDSGLTRKIDLRQPVGDDLAFAFANDLESAGAGAVEALTFFGGALAFARAATGVFAPGTNLVSSGTLTTGFIRVGTVEDKFFESIRVTGDFTLGAVELLTILDDTPVSQVSLANLAGSADVDLSLTAERLSLQFRLTPDVLDPTAGPVFRSYQLRAMPMPGRRQRLFEVPLRCFDREADRWGVERGGEGFSWARLSVLEQLEEQGSPVLFRDFRTGANRRCFIERIGFLGTETPSRENDNDGGYISLRLRAVD